MIPHRKHRSALLMRASHSQSSGRIQHIPLLARAPVVGWKRQLVGYLSCSGEVFCGKANNPACRLRLVVVGAKLPLGRDSRAVQAHGQPIAVIAPSRCASVVPFVRQIVQSFLGCVHKSLSLTALIVDNSLHFVKNFSRFVLKGLASHVYVSQSLYGIHFSYLPSYPHEPQRPSPQ